MTVLFEGPGIHILYVVSNHIYICIIHINTYIYNVTLIDIR